MPFPSQPSLLAVFNGYSNRKLIADLVLPRVTVPGLTFEYHLHNSNENFTIPDTRVGRLGPPNTVSFTGTKLSGAVVSYALRDLIPNKDINEGATMGFNPVMRAIEGLTHLVKLDREVRTAALVFAAATYPTPNKVVLSGTDQWSDTTSDPIGQIMAGLAVPMIRPNVMAIGRAAFDALIQHPKIVKAVLGNSGDSGIATMEQIARLFGLDEVIVGEARFNSAKKGLSASYSRVWGPHCALLVRNLAVNSVKSAEPTFGLTAEVVSERLAGSERDKDIGATGGMDVRVGESLLELVVAADLGYFLEACV